MWPRGRGPVSLGLGSPVCHLQGHPESRERRVAGAPFTVPGPAGAEEMEAKAGCRGFRMNGCLHGPPGGGAGPARICPAGHAPSLGPVRVAAG